MKEKALQNIFITFILKEWLAIVSGAGLIITSVYTKHLPVYSIRELQVLFILFALFVVINGLQSSGLIIRISKSIEKGKLLPLKLVLSVFFLSMIVTNDIALIVIVPITLNLNINRKDILVILEAIAANAGSALTPIGNPQNLFIYWYYKINPIVFIKTIAPFSILFFVLLSVTTLFIHVKSEKSLKLQKVDGKSYLYGIFLIILLLIVLHLIPIYLIFFIILFVAIFDRKVLIIDYSLLIVFIFFFGLADNIRFVLNAAINSSEHVFLFSALISQLISNVPAALLFSKYTIQWKALLWGVSVGGFGSLFGSLANLIAYKIFINHKSTSNSGVFTVKFLLIGYLAFFISVALYFVL